MTKLQFISELLSAINLLIEADVNSCTAHQARICLNSIFDKFEEVQDPECKSNTSGEFEFYGYLIHCLHQGGYNLWLEEQEKNTSSEVKFIQELYKLTGIPYDDLHKYMNLPVSEPDYTLEVEIDVTI